MFFLDSGSDIVDKNKIIPIESFTLTQQRKPQKAKTESDLKTPQAIKAKQLELNRRSSGALVRSTANDSKTEQQSAKQKLRNVIGRFGKAFKRVQNRAEEVLNHSKESDSDSDDGVIINEAANTIKYRSARCTKTSFDFAKTQIVQIINIKSSSSASSSAAAATVAAPTTSSNMTQTLQANSNSKSIIWSMKFSGCGKLLATGGKDQILRVWILKAFYAEFVDLKQRYNEGYDDLMNGEI